MAKVKEITLVKLTNLIDKISSEKSFKQFHKTIQTILKTYGFTYLGSGSFTDVYHREGFEYVIKIPQNKRDKFHREYGDGYLKPVYLTRNRWLAIQPKVKTYYGIEAEIYAINKERDAEINKLKSQILAIKKSYGEKTSNLRSIKKLCKESNVKEGAKICDLRVGNIGVFNGEPLMIDLNNHLKSPYSYTPR